MAGMLFPNASRRSKVALSTIAILSTAALLSACSGTSEPAASSAPAVAVDEELAALLPAEVAESGVLSLGALWETPPMIGVDENDTNVAVGIAPDLAAIVAGTLGLTPEWQNMQWPAQLPGVLSGQVDVLWGQVTGTAERESAEYDQIPFYKTTDALLMLAEDGADITGLSDMCGMTIGTGVGSTYLATIGTASDTYCVAEGEPAIETAEYQGATAAISAVRAGTVDAWIDNTTNNISAADSSNGTFVSIEIPEEQAPASYTTITVSKAMPGLTEAILGALKKSIEDGSYGEVLDAYDVGIAAVTVDEAVINPYTGLAAGATS
jgi:polar amino acid transport system substrate-binding protein